MNFKLFTCLTIATATLLVVSCNNSTDGDNHNDVVSDTTSMIIIDTTATAQDDEDVFYNLRSALQIAYMFKKSDATFNANFPNAVSNTQKYNVNNYKRAVNFGAYSSDLAYVIFNKNYQESKTYLKACKEIGGFLGINQAFESDNLAKRFDANLTNEDSLVKIVSDVQMKTDILFEQNKQKHITVLAFAGAWAESIYIASQSYKAQKTEKIRTCILEQLLLGETILKALKHHTNKEPEIKGLQTEIDAIYTSFTQIPSVKLMLESQDEVDFSKVKLTDEELIKTTDLVAKLRNSMIQ